MFPLLFVSIEARVELYGYLWEYDETHKPFLRKMDTYIDEESFADNFKRYPDLLKPIYGFFLWPQIKKQHYKKIGTLFSLSLFEMTVFIAYSCWIF